jgi:hypothetical protein
MWLVDGHAKRPDGDTDRVRTAGSIIVTTSGRIAPA